MNAKQLLFFKRTAELENMTKAAEELMVSQPFLSRVISELETELGVELFDRKWRRLVLNSYGEVFFKRVVNIFKEADDAVKEIQDLKKAQATRLKIETNVSLYMHGLLKTLIDQQPELIISQYSTPRKKIEKMILNCEVDFAICCPPIENNEAIETIVLRHEPGILIYPKGHRLEKISEVDFNDIKDETFICGLKGFGARDVMDEYMLTYNIVPKILIETVDTSSVLKYVASGLGVAIVPSFQALIDTEFRSSFTRLKNNPFGIVALCWRKGRYNNKVGKLFIEKSIEYFKSLDNFD